MVLVQDSHRSPEWALRVEQFGQEACAPGAGGGADGTELVISDARKGLVGAIDEVFQGATWQRCAAPLMHDCMRGAGSWWFRRCVGRIASPVFRARDAATAMVCIT